MKYFLAVFVLLLAGNHLNAQSPEDYFFHSKECFEAGETCEAMVIAWSGLRLREKPDLKSKTLAVIPFKGKVSYTQLSEQERNQLNYLYDQDSIMGYWQQVRWGEKTGYVFSAYLTDAVWKMDQASYLLFEQGAWCWNDAYISEDYHYYGVYANADTSVLTIKKLKPVFYTPPVWDWESTTTFSLRQKQPSYFVLATRTTWNTSKVSVRTSSQFLNVDPEMGKISDADKIDIPDSPWEIRVKDEKSGDESDGANFNSGFCLYDKKTGAWHYLFPDRYRPGRVALLWSGDFDGDGITDFMLGLGGAHSYGNALFLSSNPGKWHFVRLAGIYWWEDCC